MAKTVKIGHVEINLTEADGITEKAFIEAYKPHYRRIGNGRLKKMKSDYKELKKHFTKKKKAEN